MEIRSADAALRNRVAAAVDNSGSGEKEKQHARKLNSADELNQPELEDESVKLSISAAGLRRSLLLEKQVAGEGDKDAILEKLELEDMLKKMEGLSSQVINGHFSISDRLNFNMEISKLTNELNKLNENGSMATRQDCSQLSQKISDLTKVINDAAVYRSSARSMFMVNTTQPAEVVRTTLDIAI